MILNRLFLGLAAALMMAGAAQAQRYNDPRIDSMQQEIQAMRQEIAAGGIGGAGGAMPASSASLAAQLADIQDQMRQLRGLIEEVQHRQTRVEADMKSLTEDMDYRLRALEERNGMSAVPSAAPVTGADGAPMMTPAPGVPASPNQPAPVPGPQSTMQPPGTLAPVSGQPTVDEVTGVPEFTSAKEQYDAAFKLMNQARYAEAGGVLESFTQRYPKDPLLGNVYYWLGETYYVRENYVKAADNFRQGFETMPDGVKAPDNLYKLALSLNMMNKKREACVVLKQLQIKYQGSASPVLVKAANKEKDLGCVR